MFEFIIYGTIVVRFCAERFWPPFWRSALLWLGTVSEIRQLTVHGPADFALNADWCNDLVEISCSFCLTVPRHQKISDFGKGITFEQKLFK